MSKNVLSICVCIAVFSAFGAWAAAEGKTGDEKALGQFDPRIDTWVEGSVIALDADAGKFSIRGRKMPFASAHAEMMKDLWDKTQNLAAAEKEAKEREVRASWADRLAKARTEKVADKDSDFTFSLPAKGQLRVFHHRDVRNADYLHQVDADNKANKPQEVAADRKPENREIGAPGDEKESAAMMTLKDLKIGDRVCSGYDAGMINNEAYVVVKKDAKADNNPTR